MQNDVFWKLQHRTDQQLLAGLDRLVRSYRRDTAELVAHLGEVEARRLHLEAACCSMFEYCTKRLGLSEDEACRRIDVARLGRRFPALFPRLASGDISLTVAAALKPYLSDDNQAKVMGAVTGKSVQQAREALAALFPRPDVESSIRKLPESRMKPAASAAAAVSPMGSGATPDLSAAPSLAESNEACPSPGTDGAFSRPGLGVTESDGAGLDAVAKCAPPPRSTANCGSSLTDTAPPGLPMSASAQKALPGDLQLSAPARKTRAPIEALSVARYRVQLTASTSLKEKLERARDLMRHRNPSGDFAPIVERALELLLEQLMKERFGAARRLRSSKKRNTNGTCNAAPDQGSNAGSECGGNAASDERSRGACAARENGTASDQHSNAVSERGGTAVSSRRSRARSARVTNATRRRVAERDGLQCTWVDDQGRRCETRAWLELDHRQPRGKGGGSGPDNVRILCRAHNRLAAEHEFGCEHIEAAIAARRRASARAGEPAAHEP